MVSNKNTPPPSDTPPEQDTASSVLRRKAVHRLIGAAILVLIGILVLPWIFDAPPPELSPDIQLHIQGAENTDAPLAPANETVVAQAPQAAAPKTPAPIAPPSAKKTPEVAPKTPSKPAPQPKKAPAAAAKKPTPKPTPKPKTKPKPAPKPKPKKKPQTIDELIAQRTKKPTAAKKTTAGGQFPEKGRFVVQVGAYTEAARVRKVRQTLSKAGLKSYIQNIEVKGKTVTRVRLGPFSTRKQLQTVAAKVRALGLNASLYSL